MSEQMITMVNQFTGERRIVTPQDAITLDRNYAWSPDTADVGNSDPLARAEQNEGRYAVDGATDPGAVFLSQAVGDYEYDYKGISNEEQRGEGTTKYGISYSIPKAQIPGHIKTMAYILATMDSTGAAQWLVSTFENEEAQLLDAYMQSYTDSNMGGDLIYNPEKEILVERDIYQWAEAENNELYVGTQSAMSRFVELDAELQESITDKQEQEDSVRRYQQNKHRARQAAYNYARSAALQRLGNAPDAEARAAQAATQTADEMEKYMDPDTMRDSTVAGLAGAVGGLIADGRSNTARALVEAEGLTNTNSGMLFGAAERDGDDEGGQPEGISDNDLLGLIDSLLGAGPGGGGGPSRPVYVPPDRREVEDSVRGMLAGLIGIAPDGYLQDFTDLFMADHRRAWDKPELGLSPRASVMESIRGTSEYTRMHALRPDAQDEMQWVGQYIQGGITGGLTAEQAVGFGQNMATVGASLDDVVDAANWNKLASQGRAKGTLFDRMGAVAESMHRNVV